MKLIEFIPEERLFCSIAAAVLGAGALSAGASIWGANKASNAQSAAADKSIANQQQVYASNKNMLEPFINAGQGGISQLQNWLSTSGGNNPLSSLLKLVTPGADMSATLEQTPGFQFSKNQGTRAALNALAARGLGGSPGAIAKGVGSYVSGLAGNTWDSVVKNLLSTFQSGGNALQGLVNTGVNAGGALAGVGSHTADSISGAMTGAGNAQAAGYNAMGSALGGFGNSLTTASLLQSLTNGGGGGGIYGSGGASYGPMSTGGAPLDGYTNKPLFAAGYP